MKTKIILFFWALLLFPLFPQRDLQLWKGYKMIHPAGESEYPFFFLDHEVYRYARPDLADLLILDQNGQVVPYFITTGRAVMNKNNQLYESHQIASQIDPKKFTSTFDFQVLTADENFVVHNLYFVVEQSGYSRQVEIYGRQADTDWQLIQRDSIYQLEAVSRTAVSIPESRFRFYRIKVLQDQQPIKIKQLSLEKLENYSQYRFYQRNIDLAFKESKQERQSHLILSNPDRLKIFRLKLDIAGNFNRQFKLYDQTTDYDLLEKSNLYHFQEKEKILSNQLINIKDGYIQNTHFLLQIINQDDAPLRIKQIEAAYYVDKVVFTRQGSPPFKLYFGNHAVNQPPQYDIATYQQYIEPEKQAEIQLGPLILHETLAPDKTPFSWWNKKTLNIFIVFASIMLVIMIFLQIKKK